MKVAVTLNLFVLNSHSGVSEEAAALDPSQIYRSNERSVFYYRGNLLMAVRHGHYKMHLWTWTTPNDELEKVRHII